MRLAFTAWVESLTLVIKFGAKHVGTIHHRTDRESPGEEQRYSSTLPLTSALVWGWLVKTSSRPFYRREREPIGTHCVGDWVGPRAGQDGSGKSRPPPGFYRRNTRPTPTALSHPTKSIWTL